MAMHAGLLLTTAALAGSDAAALAQLWSGVRDSTEQVALSPDGPLGPAAEGASRRVRTRVTPITLAWLPGPVLYLEEFLQDEPDDPRRQLVMRLVPERGGVRVRLYTFLEPRRWLHLDRRPGLLAQLRAPDLATVPGCDLHLARQDGQFRGGTRGEACTDGAAAGGPQRYVRYELVLGRDLYWYRRRLYHRPDNTLLQDLTAYDRFEAGEARLFACAVDWSPSAAAGDRRRIARMDLHDKGGRGHFTTPDGRSFELTLHSQDWPFAAENDALVLLLAPAASAAPLAAAWTVVDEPSIGMDLGWLAVHCGSLLPDEDELLGWNGADPSGPGWPGWRHPAAGRG